MQKQATRTTGRTAQKANMLTAKAISDAVRTTLGPCGMDKLLVTPTNEVILTNDGATILSEMQVQHPIARMLVEVAKSQEVTVGDGTTSAVIFAGELIARADTLLEKKIHQTHIAKGYRLAKEKALALLTEQSITINPQQDELLQKIAETAMTGKGAEVAKEHLAHVAKKAVQQLDLQKQPAIKYSTQLTTAVEQTQVIPGIILAKPLATNTMPSEQTNARILLVTTPIEFTDTQTDTKMSIQSANQLNAIRQEEKAYVKGLVQKIIQTQATVVVCEKGIDEYACQLLAQQNISAYRRVRLSDMQLLSQLTHAPLCSDIDSITESDTAYISQVSKLLIAQEEHTAFINTNQQSIVTIQVCATNPHIASEIQRAIEDAVGVLKAVITTKKIVAGAGAIEIALATRLKEFAQQHPGKERLAIEQYAQALEIIPQTLAENAGLDPIDIISQLQFAHKQTAYAGVDVNQGICENVLELGIIEPAKIKEHLIESATQVAMMVLRIDDIILASADDEQVQESNQ
jgi:archaeal chaperonin